MESYPQGLSFVYLSNRETRGCCHSNMYSVIYKLQKVKENYWKCQGNWKVFQKNVCNPVNWHVPSHDKHRGYGLFKWIVSIWGAVVILIKLSLTVKTSLFLKWTCCEGTHCKIPRLWQTLTSYINSFSFYRTPVKARNSQLKVLSFCNKVCF